MPPPAPLASRRKSTGRRRCALRLRAVWIGADSATYLPAPTYLLPLALFSFPRTPVYGACLRAGALPSTGGAARGRWKATLKAAADTASPLFRSTASRQRTSLRRAGGGGQAACGMRTWQTLRCLCISRGRCLLATDWRGCNGGACGVRGHGAGTLWEVLRAVEWARRNIAATIPARTLLPLPALPSAPSKLSSLPSLTSCLHQRTSASYARTALRRGFPLGRLTSLCRWRLLCASSGAWLWATPLHMVPRRAGG